MLDQFGPKIPRHEAERLWHQRHPNETELVAPNRKIQAALHRELQRYPLEVIGTERAHGKKWQRATLIRAIARPCAYCGEPFVAIKATATCSKSHGVKLNRQNRRDVHDPELHGEPQMAPPPRHPEIAALDAIYAALRSLPDQATRHRVMTYAKHLIESGEGDDDPVLVLRVADRANAD